MNLIIKKQINKTFWILRFTLGFIYIVAGIYGLITVHALNNPVISATLPQNFYNLGISALTYSTILSCIDLLIGILFFTPYVRAAVYTALTWLLIKHGQSTYLLITLIPVFGSNMKLVMDQILKYYNKTIFGILLFAALLAFDWIAQARDQLKD